MKEEILLYLTKLEKEKHIDILYAVESGSRAWGCPSPDSDFDIRIVFKRSKSEYLEIDDKPDNIDYFHGKLLDINGWDVKKTFKLIRRSNATPFEWVQSPIVYREMDGMRQKVLELCKAYFQPRHSVNHYLGIAKNSYFKNELGESIKLKKLFYVLRPLMAAKWIAERREVPPMDIPNLIEIFQDQSIVDQVHTLLEIKNDVNEDYIHKVDPSISKFILSEFESIAKVELPEARKDMESEMLNLAFKNIIGA